MVQVALMALKSNTRVSVTSGHEIERSVLLTDFLMLIVTISWYNIKTIISPS